MTDEYTAILGRIPVKPPAKLHDRGHIDQRSFPRITMPHPDSIYDARTHGMAAKKMGRPIHNNPYDPIEARHCWQAWCDAWMEAQVMSRIVDEQIAGKTNGDEGNGFDFIATHH
jgi:hypothetical protein